MAQRLRTFRIVYRLKAKGAALVEARDGEEAREKLDAMTLEQLRELLTDEEDLQVEDDDISSFP